MSTTKKSNLTREEKAKMKEAQERLRLTELYAYEDEYYKKGYMHVAGVDEVGRGPLAGAVTVCALILPPFAYLPGLNDSKKLSPKKREALHDAIVEEALAISVISYGPEIIDRINIYEATRQAMYEAIKGLSVQADALLVDAMPLPDCTVPCQSLVKGDSKSASIAAASIVAKVRRDRYMIEMDEVYKGYGFASHKGYGTAKHIKAIHELGITPLHRKSFEPIKSLVIKNSK